MNDQYSTKLRIIYILYKSQEDIQKMYNISDFSQIDIVL